MVATCRQIQKPGFNGMTRYSAGRLATLAVRDQDLIEKSAVGAPLPFLGVHVRYGITRKLRFTAPLGFLAIKLDEFEGRQIVLGATFEHQTTKHFGLGIRLDLGNISGDFDDGDLMWDLDSDIFVVAFFAKLKTSN